MKSRTLPLTKRPLNFEMIMWVFTRLSALGIYFFLLLGAIGALVMGARAQMNLADIMRWSFMPNINHVQNTNVPNLDIWSSPFWKFAGSGLILLAVSHGVHGLVVIADDYIVTTIGRKIVRLISIVLMAAFSFIGLYIIWTS